MVAVEQGVKLELTSRLLFCSEVAVAAAAAPAASATADDSTSPGYNADYIHTCSDRGLTYLRSMSTFNQRCEEEGRGMQ